MPLFQWESCLYKGKLRSHAEVFKTAQRKKPMMPSFTDGGRTKTTVGLVVASPTPTEVAGMVMLDYTTPCHRVE